MIYKHTIDFKANLIQDCLVKAVQSAIAILRDTQTHVTCQSELTFVIASSVIYVRTVPFHAFTTVSFRHLGFQQIIIFNHFREIHLRMIGRNIIC